MRWLVSPITSSYARMWDVEGLSLSRAKRMMGAVSASDAEFEAAGEKYAADIRRWIQPDWRVLDLGCGIGRIAKYVAPHCAELLAVDASPRMLHLARRRLNGASNVRFRRINGTDLSGVETDSLDFCYCIQVLHQIEREHTMRYMVELARVIRPGGGVYLQLLDFEDPRNAGDFREYALESKVLRISRRRCFTASEVRVLAELAGYVDTAVTKDGDSLILTARIPRSLEA
jgi:ubiquinone/menaquinone biosynthesis C-methylase UbiE